MVLHDDYVLWVTRSIPFALVVLAMFSEAMVSFFDCFARREDGMAIETKFSTFVASASCQIVCDVCELNMLLQYAMR